MQLINITQNHFLNELSSSISFAQQYTYGAITVNYYRMQTKEKLVLQHPTRNLQPKEIKEIYQQFPFPIPDTTLSYTYLYYQFQLEWKKLPN